MLLKNHRYGNASREKTVTAVWRKISEVIEKSLREIFKKTADQYQVWFPSYNESKKRIFPRRRANLVAPTVYVLQTVINSIAKSKHPYMPSRVLRDIIEISSLLTYLFPAERLGIVQRN